jgi:hypothetical protein
MGKVADMGAGGLDDLAVGVDQRVGLARQRRRVSATTSR